jgi:hypothetical protein
MRSFVIPYAKCVHIVADGKHKILYIETSLPFHRETPGYDLSRLQKTMRAAANLIGRGREFTSFDILAPDKPVCDRALLHGGSRLTYELAPRVVPGSKTARRV